MEQEGFATNSGPDPFETSFAELCSDGVAVVAIIYSPIVPSRYRDAPPLAATYRDVWIAVYLRGASSTDDAEAPRLRAALAELGQVLNGPWWEPGRLVHCKRDGPCCGSAASSDADRTAIAQDRAMHLKCRSHSYQPNRVWC